MSLKCGHRATAGFLDTIQRFFAYFYLWQVQTVRCGSRDQRCRWCRCSPTHPSQLACYISRTHRKKVTILMHNFTLQTWGSSFRHLLHTVVHRQKCLQSFPLQHIGELHVDRLHRSCVAHDPVLVQVWCIVITRSTKGKGERKDKMAECLDSVIPFMSSWQWHKGLHDQGFLPDAVQISLKTKIRKTAKMWKKILVY